MPGVLLLDTHATTPRLKLLIGDLTLGERMQELFFSLSPQNQLGTS